MALTANQRTTLLQIGRGLTTAEMAAEEHLSGYAIKSRITDLYRALGAHHRAEAVLLAVRDGHTTVDELLAGTR